MTAFTLGDVVIGGALGYAEHITPTGTHVQELDILDDLGSRMRCNGITFAPDGTMFTAHGDPLGAEDYDPHDVVWMPNGSGLLVILARTNNTALLRLYDPVSHTVTATWTGLALDTGWTPTQMLKLDVLCDSRTVYYTDRGRTIFRYDLQESVQLSHFQQFAAESPYAYAAFKLRRGGEIIVAVTTSGNGPRNAVCLDKDPLYHWTDEINPPGVYHVFKRLTEDGSMVLQHSVQLTPTGSAEVFSLGCYMNPCSLPRVWGQVIG